MEMRTFDGASGVTYLVLRTNSGSFHVFAEIEAKQAARDCGSAGGHNTRTEWQEIWDAR
jgi:hypothetical protein